MMKLCFFAFIWDSQVSLTIEKKKKQTIECSECFLSHSKKKPDTERNEFPEKYKQSGKYRIGHLGRQLDNFCRTFQFFIGQTDKTDTFQELCIMTFQCDPML